MPVVTRVLHQQPDSSELDDPPNAYDVALIIIDKAVNMWTYMNPSMDKTSSASLLRTVKVYLSDSFSQMKGYSFQTISITSFFHAAYKMLHLILATFYLAKAFKTTHLACGDYLYGDLQIFLSVYNYVPSIQKLQVQLFKWSV